MPDSSINGNSNGQGEIMLRGSCLCGGVHFEVQGTVHEMGNCHCTQCRKAYGSAFGTIAVVSRDGFSYTSGLELIVSFKSTERVTRYHCRNCGSPSWWDIADEQPRFEAWPPARDMNERAKKLKGDGA
jgi:hypothetical protein